MSKRKTIFRRAKQSQFFTFDRQSAQDKALSYEAVGMLAYILSKPDDWEIHPSDLIRKGCSRNRVYKLLKELIEAGFIVREIERDDHARVTAFVYKVYDCPLPQKQEMETPQMENRDSTYNRDIQSREKDSVTLVTVSKTSTTKSPTGRNPNPWYDAVKTVWPKYDAQMNGAMQKMLQGKATAPSWKMGNVTILITPSDLMAWAEWYRKTELGGNDKLNMLEDRMKIKSSIGYWDSIGRPAASLSILDTLRIVS